MTDYMDMIQAILSMSAHKDSLEFGPANARIKVYVNSSNVDEGKEKIRNMKELRSYAESE